MKDRLTKIIVTLAALALVVPFLSGAFLLGARAVAGAGNMQDNLLLVALAVLGAAASVAKNMSRPKEANGHEPSLRIASTGTRNVGGAFVGAPSQT